MSGIGSLAMGAREMLKDWVQRGLLQRHSKVLVSLHLPPPLPRFQSESKVSLAGVRWQVVMDIVHCTWQSTERDKLKGSCFISSRVRVPFLCRWLYTFPLPPSLYLAFPPCLAGPRPKASQA